MAKLLVNRMPNPWGKKKNSKARNYWNYKSVYGINDLNFEGRPLWPRLFFFFGLYAELVNVMIWHRLMKKISRNSICREYLKAMFTEGNFIIYLSTSYSISFSSGFRNRRLPTFFILQLLTRKNWETKKEEKGREYLTATQRNLFWWRVVLNFTSRLLTNFSRVFLVLQPYKH